MLHSFEQKNGRKHADSTCHILSSKTTQSAINCRKHVNRKSDPVRSSLITAIWQKINAVKSHIPPLRAGRAEFSTQTTKTDTPCAISRWPAFKPIEQHSRFCRAEKQFPVI